MKKIVTIEDHLSAEMAMMYCLADMLETQQVVDAAEEHVEACDEDGCSYADEEDAKVAFENGVAWLKLKTIM